MATRKKVKPIPAGYNTVTPYLSIKKNSASKAIDYYKKAFGAKELVRMPGPDGTVGHAELKIGDSVIMLADEMDGMGNKSPQSLGGSPVGLMIYVKDVDATYKGALKLGGKELQPLENKFYGDRSGTLTDPFGHCWTIATHVEDVPPKEMEKRMKAMKM